MDFNNPNFNNFNNNQQFQNNFPQNIFQGQNQFNQMGMGMNQDPMNMNQNIMGMNQMGMNQVPMNMNQNAMDMNQLGINQNPMNMNQNGMGINQMLMNQILMNQMLMNQMGMNQNGMNQMDVNQNQGQNFNNNFGSSQNNPNANNSETITVKFLKFQEGYTITAVTCSYSEKVDDLINRYREKTQDYDLTEKFVFNTKNLCPDLTVAEQGLINGAHIKIIVTKGIRGAII